MHAHRPLERHVLCAPRQYGASALGFSSACALIRDVILGHDSRLPLVGSQSNRLPPTWAAMWIDFHLLLLLLPAALVLPPSANSTQAPKEATAAQRREYERTDASITQATLLLTTGTACFFALTCCSRSFAPALAVFALPVASVASCSIFSRLLEHSSTNIGSVTKRRRHVAVSEVVVNTLLALCVFVAVMSVPDALVQRFVAID